MKREEELLKAAKKELDSAYVAKKELLRNADIKRQDILSLQKKQQEKQKRLIWLYVTREKQFVRIRTENYCDEKIQFKNGMPVTTKKDRRLHGYGMKSIKSTVEKYNGSVVAAQENNWFELKILLPAAM